MGSIFLNLYKGVNKPTSHKQKEKLKEAKQQRFLKAALRICNFLFAHKAK